MASRHHLLDNIQIEISLALVSHEARDIALAWMRGQDIKMRFSNKRQCYIFMRPFDQMRDTLYVPLDQKHDFFNEHWDRMDDPGLEDCYFTIQPQLTYIALPQALLQTDITAICKFFEISFEPKGLFILVDAQPNFEDNSTKMQQEWEPGSSQGPTLL